MEVWGPLACISVYPQCQAGSWNSCLLVQVSQQRDKECFILHLRFYYLLIILLCIIFIWTLSVAYNTANIQFSQSNPQHHWQYTDNYWISGKYCMQEIGQGPCTVHGIENGTSNQKVPTFWKYRLASVATCFKATQTLPTLKNIKGRSPPAACLLQSHKTPIGPAWTMCRQFNTVLL